MAIVAKTPIAQPKASAGTPRTKDGASAAPRKAAPKPPAKKRAGRPAPKVASGRLPGWGDLGMAPMARRTSRLEQLADRLPARRFYLGLLLLLVAVVGYVGHIYATKQLYRDLQATRSEHLQLRLKHNRLRGELDAATAPSVVVGRAKALGLDEGISYGPTLDLAK